MRIALWYNLPSGGAKRALFYQVKGLVEKGHTVEVWCPSTANTIFMPICSIAKENVCHINWPAIQGNTAIGQIKRYFDISKKIKLLAQHSRAVADEINNGNFDVLLAHGDQYLASPTISRYIKIPSVLYLQEPNRQVHEAHSDDTAVSFHGDKDNVSSLVKLMADTKGILKTLGYKTKAEYEYLNASSFDRILVNSRFSRESILRAYGLDPYVCYLGIDTNVFRPSPNKESSSVVVGVGSITKAKNIQFIIKSISLLKNRSVSLKWIGNFADKDYMDNLVKMAKSLSVKFDIMIGLSEKDLVSEISSSYIMAYSPRLEPFGFVTLEANACGVPVVAVAEGGVRETVRNGINGYLCTNSSIDMAEKIGWLFENDSVYKTLSNSCRKYVEDNWSWERSIDELEEHLKAVVTKKVD